MLQKSQNEPEYNFYANYSTYQYNNHISACCCTVRAGMNEQEERRNKRGATGNDIDRDNSDKEEWLKDKNNNKGGQQLQKQDR